MALYGSGDERISDIKVHHLANDLLQSLPVYALLAIVGGAYFRGLVPEPFTKPEEWYVINTVQIYA
jgi:hypothetical protein